MNTIVFDNIIFSLQKTGGISVVWYELLKRILKIPEYDIRLIDRKYVENPFRKLIDIDALKVVKYKECLPLTRYLPISLNYKEPFIFHSSYYRYCKNSNAINVTTVHDFTYEYYRTGFAKKLHCWQKYKAIRHSDIVVCISENTKKDLLRFLPDIDVNRIHVIYNGVSDEYYVIDRNVTHELPFPSRSYLVFIGSRVNYKNFELVVRGCAKSNYNLVIVGSPLTETEIEQINKSISSSQYKAVGYLPNKELNIVYNYAAALAYPSSYEGFGIPVIEAQRAGCPVIAYNCSSIPEVIGETPLLMTELSDEEFLSKLRLLSEEKVISKVVINGLKNSRRFSWERMFQEYVDLYCSLIKNIK